MSDIVSLEGPIELENGELVVRIPLALGGDKLAPLATQIGRIDGADFVVIIKPWLAEKMRIGENSLVIVDNAEGKFRITRSDANDA